MNHDKSQVAGYRFDDIFLDAHNRQLWRQGRLVPLNSKYFEVLLLLVRQSGQLVEKQRLFDEVWQGVIVTDAALTQCIKDIRKQLGDEASNPRYIKTVPKHGYIFIGQPVEVNGETTASSSPPIQVVERAHRPYKFLDYYTEQDAPLFFGREPEIESICSQILAHRSFIIHGRSGAGKSSIVCAGLLPRLKAMGHLAFAIRSFTDPMQQMVKALLPVVDGGDSSSLEELLSRAASDSSQQSVVFFLDQFEEFFLLLGEDSRKKFVEALGRLLAHENVPLRLVFTLREDLLAEMSQFKTAIPEVFHHEYRLKRLSREQAAAAITEPARVAGCRYEAELVQRLLDDLTEQDGIDPPQLQIVCDQLYDTRGHDNKLTVAAYERLGTASKIIAGYLARVLRRFNTADLRIAKEILKALISPDGQRLILRGAELHGRLKKFSGNANAIVEELVAARVVRCRNQDGEGWLELAHDYLLPEVSRWLTAEDRALKRARGVLERALENYRAHQLLIDAETLDLLLPHGEQLGLSSEEGDLLAKSILYRSRPLPEWLVARSPSLLNLIVEAAGHDEASVRLRAIEACRWVRHREIRDMLRRVALWDRHLNVRKAASIALADWLGEAAGDMLYRETAGEKAGLLRRVVSLALIRDHQRNMLPLAPFSLIISGLIIGALIWVRLRRNWTGIIRQSVSGTLGGAMSGIAGGFFLGLALAVVRHTTAVEAMSLILVLISLGLFIGASGAFGISFGMVAAAHVTYRHHRFWAVIGGAAGGAAVGWSAHLIGVDMLQALFGQSPTGITGAFEGAMIGAGLSLGALVAGGLVNGRQPWQRIFGAALGSMLAGIVLAIIGGNLFSSSLELIARSFANSQIRLEPLASFFGEMHFGRTTQIALGAIEGFLFGGGLTGGMEFLSRQPRR
ncbi:MAG: winged helix-turn-helix domain-containing protein [candidate division KSB1 bacterium]|nr:winged helix-turn-helix domain-containing protein [candidate division KSB1 bacterium]MDZ7366623.1 winged helix-turn-helix domain-containing protein [candidate division KSB1 bacterium]MDZ7404634.1 winged helix-turn-helix domain-containing protein [candidate division KSB1 bacterium]